MADEALERDDVQGLLVRAYGGLPAASYVVAEIVDPARARTWLGGLDVAGGGAFEGDVAVNVAFTASGLEKLGLAAGPRAQFSREFLDGMTTPHRRRVLGDVEESAPEHWGWGAPGGPPIDVLLLVFAASEAALADALATQERALQTGGLEVVIRLDTAELSEHEHFGFADGISQPRVRLAGAAERDIPSRDLVATGELALGYRNEYGRFTPRPLVARDHDPGGLLPADAEGSDGHDLGRNGTYLVFRQLSQDVEGFWAFCEQATRRPDGSADAGERVRLAAKMVGRWPSGSPLALAADADRPVPDRNDFAYFGLDRTGLRCPIGSHVRRANPRDTLDPAPGTDRSVAVNKRHRLLRRGRKYGSLAPQQALVSQGAAAARGADERGLHFICLVANISRQFEFVQHSWLNDPRFNGLYDHPDPLVSPAPPGGRTFTVQAEPVRRRYTGLPRFVSVRGGAYFFMPGLRALRYLAELPPS